MHNNYTVRDSLCVLKVMWNHGMSGSSSCRRGRLELVATPIPMPLASSTSIATFAAPSEDFLVRVRVLRNAPNAWALITARVPEIGGVVGEGDRDSLS